MPGILLLPTDGGSDSDAWDDVLERMGELPGMRPPGAGGAAEAEASIPRRISSSVPTSATTRPGLPWSTVCAGAEGRRWT
ncbi:hypothetical protein ACIBQ3_02425 [Streptomyces rubiginosohelvolus]|uniref:hypothetical protein n=1 Tax=Streptomyces rubiginosohelvolus TaxID=67362 RepID=UPI0037929405